MFWRGWHASFNKWITRYMYIPLRGRENPFSLWIIFVFAAMWHDFDRKLFTWGLLNAFFYMIEIAGRAVSKATWFETLDPTTHRALRVMAGGLFVFVLMGGNLIGYAFGVDGFIYAIGVFTRNTGGASTLIMCFIVVCAAVRVMMAIEDISMEVRTSNHTGASCSQSPHPNDVHAILKQ